MNLLNSQPDLFWGGAFVLIALAILARLMMNRRNQVLAELYAQIEAERAEKEAAAKAALEAAPPPRRPKAVA